MVGRVVNDMGGPQETYRMIESVKPIVNEVVQKQTTNPSIPLPLKRLISQKVGAGSFLQRVKEFVGQEEKSCCNRRFDQRGHKNSANTKRTARYEVFEVVNI